MGEVNINVDIINNLTDVVHADLAEHPAAGDDLVKEPVGTLLLRREIHVVEELREGRVVAVVRIRRSLQIRENSLQRRWHDRARRPLLEQGVPVERNTVEARRPERSGHFGRDLG